MKESAAILPLQARLQQLDYAKVAQEVCQRTASKAATDLQLAVEALHVVELEQQKIDSQFSALQTKEAEAKTEYLSEVGGVESVVETILSTVRMLSLWFD